MVASVVTVPATPTRARAADVSRVGSAAAASARSVASSSAVGGSVCRWRSERRTQPIFRLARSRNPSGPPRTSSVEPPPMSQISVPSPTRSREQTPR